MGQNKNNIYLIGYRAVGKTTIGKALAEKLKRPFVDADVELEKEQGRTIAEIVSAGGWKEFRRLEKELLTRLSLLDDHVIAPGGGAVMDPDNESCMKKTGLVVWLTATPETICQRLAEDSKTGDQRPALTDKGVLEEVISVLDLRTPVYKNAADLIISTDNDKVELVCKRILKGV